MSEPSDKAGMDCLAAWVKEHHPDGGYPRDSVIWRAMLSSGRLIVVDGKAVWPDPPDPDAEYDAAVDRLLDCRERQFLTGRGGAAEALTLIRLDLSNARAARDAAKGKAVLK